MIENLLGALLLAVIAQSITLLIVWRSVRRSLHALRILVADGSGRTDKEILALYSTEQTGGLHLPEGYEQRFRADDDEPDADYR